MIFDAKTIIAMENNEWQLILFPHNNGIAIFTRSCNKMLVVSKIATTCTVATITNATMELVAISVIATISCVEFAFLCSL
jgi:hypothetical protein